MLQKMRHVFAFVFIALSFVTSGLSAQAGSPVELVFQQWSESEAMEISPDGHYLLSLNQGTLQTWDLRTGKQLYQVNDIDSFCQPPLWISQDSSLFASNCSGDFSSPVKNLRVWQMSSGKEIEDIAHFPLTLNTPFDISSDNQYLASVQRDSARSSIQILISDRKNKKIKATIEGLPVFPEIIRFVNQDRYLLFSSGTPQAADSPDSHSGHLERDPTLILWDLQKNQAVKTLQSPEWKSPGAALPIVRLNPLIDQAGKIMVVFPEPKRSGFEEQSIPEIWNLETGQKIKSLPPRTALGIKPQALSQDGTLLAYADKTQVKLYHIPSQRLLFEKNLALTPMVFSPDNRYLYLSARHQGIQVLDIEQQKIVKNFQGFFYWSERSEYNPESGILVQKGTAWGQEIEKPYIQIWDLRQGKRSFAISNREHKDPPEDFRLSKDGKTLAVIYRSYNIVSGIGETSQELQLYAIEQGGLKKLNTFHLPFIATSRFIKEAGLPKKLWDFSPNGKSIYFAYSPSPPSSQGMVLLKRLQLSSGKTEDLMSLPSTLESFIVSSQEKLLIAESQNSTQFWSLPNTKIISENRQQGPSSGIRNGLYQTISPDDQYYVINASSHPTEIWSLKNFKRVRSLGPQALFPSSLPLSPELRGIQIYRSQFSPDGKYFFGFYPVEANHISQGREKLGITLWRTEDWSLLTNKEMAGFWGLPSGISVKTQDKLWAYTRNGEILEWNLKNDTTTRFYLAGSAQGWALATDQGYYRSSQEGINMLAFHVGEHAFPFEQFDLNFNRPDKILEALNAPKEDIQLYHQAWQKRLRRLNIREEWLKLNFHLPELTLLTEQIPPATSEPFLKLKVQAKDSDFALDRLMVYDNDVPIHGRQGLFLNARNQHTLEQEIEIPLVPGTNKIQLSVLNQAGTESLRETVSIQFTGQTARPTLHLITVGVSEYRQTNFNLRYAAKDAQDIHTYFKNKAKLKYELRQTQLLNRQVSRETVLKLRKQLEQSRPQDRVILFFAGHGLLDQEKNYYFAPHEINFDHPEKEGLRFEEIEDLLDGIPAREKLLLIDTCNAGELDKELQAEQISFTQPQGLIKARAIRGFKITQHLGINKLNQLLEENFHDLRRDTGATIITSSQGLEYALESAQWKNGVFTFALLEGLQSRTADLNADGEVKVSELKNYIIQKVQELTRSAQTPNFRRVNLNNDFAL